jgi:hypothetical protein
VFSPDDWTGLLHCKTTISEKEETRHRRTEFGSGESQRNNDIRNNK